MLKVVPQFFFDKPDTFPHLYHDFSSCILYKKLDTTNQQSDYFLSTHLLTIIIKGSKIIRTYEGEQIIVRENEMILMPKDLYMVQDIIADKEQFESWLFFISDEVIGKFLDYQRQSGINGYRFPNKESAVIPMFNKTKIIDHFTDNILSSFPLLGNQSDQLVTMKLQELLQLMSLSDQRDEFYAAISSIGKKQRNVKILMETHFDKPLRVEDYATLAGRSLTSFQRDFKKMYGTSPKQWLMTRRMEKSRDLLEKANYSVTRAAYESGYENISHFIKAFKKQFGITPGQYAGNSE
ncbi:MAG: helix-turn-helix domain-containing protein [Cyclobacteriaceae bacterium]